MTILVIIAVLACGAWWIKSLSGASQSTEYSSIKELSRICGGNTEQIKRLITAEQKRNEKLDYEGAAKAAIKSYKRDNR